MGLNFLNQTILKIWWKANFIDKIESQCQKYWNRSPKMSCIVNTIMLDIFGPNRSVIIKSLTIYSSKTAKFCLFYPQFETNVDFGTMEHP